MSYQTTRKRSDMSIYKNAFAGSDYIPIRDDARLSRQIDRVYACMKDGKRRTLSQISEITGDPEASVSEIVTGKQNRQKRFCRCSYHFVS